jgi:hypothetical protein
MEVTEQQMLEVLRDSVIHGLEAGVKGSKFPTFHQYLEMEGDDVDNETVKKLREDFARIKEVISGLETGLYQDENFVQVTAVNGRAYPSHMAPVVLQATGFPRKYPSREKLVDVVNIALERCDEAIRRNCGFGKYTTN